MVYGRKDEPIPSTTLPESRHILNSKDSTDEKSATTLIFPIPPSYCLYTNHIHECVTNLFAQGGTWVRGAICFCARSKQMSHNCILWTCLAHTLLVPSHLIKAKAADLAVSIFRLCPERDSNPHPLARPAPQAGVYTNSTTWARVKSCSTLRVSAVADSLRVPHVSRFPRECVLRVPQGGTCAHLIRSVLL